MRHLLIIKTVTTEMVITEVRLCFNAAGGPKAPYLVNLCFKNKQTKVLNLSPLASLLSVTILPKHEHQLGERDAFALCESTKQNRKA